jgi:site-specific recombinase XerD
VTKVLHMPAEDIRSTLLYKQHQNLPEEILLFQARVQAYSANTWKNYRYSVQSFFDFCFIRELNIFECTPYIVNLYIMHRAQKGDSYASIKQKLNAVSFVFRFFLVPDPTTDTMVKDVLKFVNKVAPHNTRKKEGFGSQHVRSLWDKLEKKYKNIESIPLLELRSFVMIVTQHATLCRYSDIQELKLSNVVHDVDFFKLNIQYSKTDQGGIGQVALLPKGLDGYHDAHMLMCLYLHLLSRHAIEPDCYLFPPLK